MAVNTAYTQNSNIAQPDGPKRKSGRITFPSTSITAADYVVQEVGFTPVEVRWINNTSRIRIEWYQGMADDTCMKIAAAGTGTIETTNLGITICDSDGTANANGKYFKVSQNATLAAILASQVCNWVAVG